MVPNPMASGLIAYLLAIFYMQSRNQLCFCPLFLLREFCRYLLGKTEKAGRATIFLYFDLALHMMFFHIAFFLLIKKNGENLQDFSLLLAHRIIACIFS
jgi:hypothetical protein